MLNLTVIDILNLPFIGDYRVVAGNGGLSNRVHYPNVFDNPWDPETDPYTLLSSKDDFYLTSFYHGKDNPQYIIDTIKWYVQIKASAVCIIDQYIDDIPDSAKIICNQHNLPVIFISQNTPYSLIISNIIEYKLAAEQMKLASNQFSALTSNRISENEKHQIIHDLNPDFQSNALCFYFIDNHLTQTEVSPLHHYLNLINRFNYGITSFVSQHRQGILLIYTFKETPAIKVAQIEENICADIRGALPDALIGLSDVCYTAELGKAIAQACMSISSGMPPTDNIIRFRDLGITRLLVGIMDHPALNEFYRDTTDPILTYDRETGSHLFETLLAFVENASDFRRTSQALYLHENTVRYRLNKIRELINFGKNEIDFYETVSIIYKIYMLKNY